MSLTEAGYRTPKVNRALELEKKVSEQRKVNRALVSWKKCIVGLKAAWIGHLVCLASLTLQPTESKVEKCIRFLLQLVTSPRMELKTLEQ